MKGNLYKFTVECVEDTNGNAVDSRPLTFETRNHEDIFKIIDILQSKVDLDQEDTTAFAVGIKLFSSVMMKHRDNELFWNFKPHFIDFMKELKKV